MSNDAPVHIFNGDAEILPINFALAYTALVPLVVEAFTYIECGNVEAGRQALSRARKTIEFGSSFAMVIKGDQLDGVESGLL